MANLARIIRNRENGWRKDYLGLMPLYDRGGAISLTPSADADLGALASIELKRLDDQREAREALRRQSENQDDLTAET